MVGFVVFPNKDTTYIYKNTTTYANITIPKTHLNCNCHTQGVAWDNDKERLVITCKGTDKKSHILLFSYNNSSAEIKFIASNSTDGMGRGFSHPSAIQIYKSIMPVAIAEGKNDSSIIMFYTINDSNIVESEISTIYYPKHIGALSIALWENKIYLMGVGWDAEYYALWCSANNENLDFKLVAEGSFSEISNTAHEAYNSLWLGLNSIGELELFASCGSYINKKNNFIDVYDVHISNKHIVLHKKDRINVTGITQHTTKSLFFEGVSIKKYGNDSIELFSAPQDFKKIGNKTVLKNLYKGVLIKK